MQPSAGVGFCQSQMWLRLSLVNGVRCQSAMRSSSAGHTQRCLEEKVRSCPSIVQ